MNNIILIDNVNKEIKEFSVKNNPYKIVCEIGTIDDVYTGIAFQCIYKNSKIQSGSFIEMPYGYKPIGDLEEDKQLIELLDQFTIYMANTYHISWDEKPIMEETHNEL